MFVANYDKDDFLWSRSDDHRLSFILGLLESRFESILAASVPADVQFLELGDKVIRRLFSLFTICIENLTAQCQLCSCYLLYVSELATPCLSFVCNLCIIF